MQNQEIKLFEGNELRIANVNDDYYFCLSDVCKILEIVNNRNINSRLDCDGVHCMDIIDSKGRIQKATFVSEPNLYRVIFESRKPEAKRFQDWVFNDVLPEIRKTGGFNLDKISKTDLAKMIIEAEKERELLTKQIEQDKPKVKFANDFQVAEGNILVRKLAKMIGIGQNELFNWLIHNKILINTYEPYQYYMNLGWFKMKAGTHSEKGKSKTHYTITITPKGQYGIWSKYNNLGDQPDMFKLTGKWDMVTSYKRN